MRSTLRILFLVALALLSGCDNEPLIPVAVPERSCPDPYAQNGACTDLSDYIHTVGLLNTSGDSRGVFAADGWAYLADGDGGVLVVDVCDFAHPVVVAHLPLPGVAQAVTATGRYLYVAAGDGGLSVVDIDRRETPHVVGHAETAGGARDVAVAVRRTSRPPQPPLVETFAYVADDVLGLAVFDVSDPSQPKARGIENTPGRARAVRVDGDVAYVADEQLGLRVVSVASVDDPWLVRAVATPGKARDVAVSGGYAYIADGIAGLTVVDVASPAAAAVVRTIDTAGGANAVALGSGRGEGFLYVAAAAEGVLVFDLTDPAAPRLVSRSYAEGVATGLAWDNGLLFAADNSAGLRVIDVTEPLRSPFLARTLPIRSDPIGLLADGDFFYVANHTYGVFVEEWRDDHFVLHNGTVGLGSDPTSMFEYNDFLYVGTTAGVWVVDARSRESLGTVGGGILPGSIGTLDLAIADSVAFFARGLVRPVMLDLRGDGTPVALSITGALTRAVATGAFYAYFVQAQGRIVVTELDPNAVQPVRWSLETRGSSSDVAVHGDILSGQILYVANQNGFQDATGADYSAGVEVYSLDDPMMPEFVTLVETSIPAERIVLSGDYMVVTGADDGIEVLDISDPYAPEPIGAYWWDGPVADAAFVGGAVILALGQDGLLALPPLCAR